MRFVYLTWTPYSQRFHEFWVAPLLARGFEVSVVDCTACVRAASYKEVRLPDARDYEHLHVCTSREDVARALARFTPQDMLFSLVHLSKQTLFLYRLIHRLGLRFCAYQPESMPFPPSVKGEDRSALQRLIRRWGSWNKARLTLCRSFRFPNRRLGVAEAELLFINSSHVPEPHYPVGPGTRLVRTHCFDYELFLGLREELAKGSGLFADDGRVRVVFLESAAPSHPDRFWTGNRAQLTPEVYFPEITAFLRELTRKYDLDLLVAAHPRAVWEGRLEHYAEFRMVQGKSLQAVAQADLVLTHASQSASFAVMLRKPMSCLNTDEFENNRLGLHAKAMAGALGKTAYNISRGAGGFDLERELAVDEARYDRYVRDYLDADGSDRSFWDVLAEACLGLK
ncbi:MAG: hypothetical protein AB7D57_04025 [Desulfovibrionaceae bacterium]